MLDLDRRFLLDLSQAALQAVVGQTPDVVWIRYDTLSPYSSVSLSAQQPGLKLRSRVARSEGISQRHLEWWADCDCNVALDIHRQQRCKVPLPCKVKDTSLRKRQQDDFEGCVKTNNNKLQEARLEKILLDKPPAELRGFPYLCARDYESAGGKGDLVFTDGQGLYAVIEVKHINLQGSNVKQKRRKVIAQARKYGQAFRANNSAAVVVVAACYTEESARLQWIALDGQDQTGVQQFIEAVAATNCNIRTGSSREPDLSCSARQGSAEFQTSIVAAAPEEMSTSGDAKANGPVLSNEAREILALGAGIVAVAGLGILLDSSTRRQRRRREQEDLEFTTFGDFIVFVLMFSLPIVWVLYACRLPIAAFLFQFAVL